MRLRSRIALMCFALSLAPFTAEAKRVLAKPVSPVESNGVRYSAEDAEYVAATDIATGTQLWKVRVFHTHFKPWMEADVQWVFITDLKLVDSSLFVRDEKARCYAVEVKDHRVRKAACSDVFPEHQNLRQ